MSAKYTVEVSRIFAKWNKDTSSPTNLKLKVLVYLKGGWLLTLGSCDQGLIQSFMCIRLQVIDDSVKLTIVVVFYFSVGLVND